MAKNFKTTRITPTSFAGTTGAADEVVFNPTGIDLYFFQLGTNDLGTLGGVIDITDPELLANKFLGLVKVPGVANGASGDAILSRVATIAGVDLIVQAEDLSSSIFVAAVCDTSTVSTAAGKELVFGFEQL